MNLKLFFEKINPPKISGVIFFILSLTSASLWFSAYPDLPRCPVFGKANYSESIGIFDFILNIITFLLLSIGLWIQSRRFVIYGILCLIISCIIDTNRFTAITYFFICFWVLWLLYFNQKNLFQSTLVIFLAGIYFWSGFHKWNIHFYAESYQWLMNLSPMTRGLTDSKWLSIILPALEALPALFILFPKSRKIGIIWLILMHIYIIYFMTIVEWGKGVFIWNIFMILCLLFIWNFIESLSIFISKKNKFSIIILSFISIIIPLLFCFNLVSAELSYSMYCGRYTSGNMAFTSTDINKLDKKYHSYLQPYQDFYILDMDYFGFKTYEAELCRTEFTYKKMFQKLSEPFSDTCMLVIVKKPMFSQEIYEYVYKD